MTKRWRGFHVDRGLKDEWLERVNEVQGASVVSVCAGHINGIQVGNGETWASVCLCMYPRVDDDKYWARLCANSSILDDVPNTWVFLNGVQFGKGKGTRQITLRIQCGIPRTPQGNSKVDEWWESISRVIATLKF